MHHDDFVAGANCGSAPRPTHVARPVRFDRYIAEVRRSRVCSKLSQSPIEAQDLLVFCEESVRALDSIL
jgi:hypothetical protein